MSTPRQRGTLPKPVDIQRALEEVIVSLSTVTNEYALIGGVALAFYGIERFTNDVDLAVRQSASERVAPTLQTSTRNRFVSAGLRSSPRRACARI
jgi:hypothetical protein